MRTYENEICSGIKKEMEKAGIGVRLDTVVGQNGITKHNVSIITSPGIGGEMVASPTININGYVDDVSNGMITVDEAVSSIVGRFEMGMAVKENMEIAKALSFKKENLFAVALSREKNLMYLADAPHYDIGDISIAIRCRVGETGSFLVRNDILGKFELTGTEAIEEGIKNVESEPYSIKPMGEVLSGILDEPVEEAGIFVATNNRNFYGAVRPFVDMDIRKQIYEEVGGDYIIIPSSIHEVLLMRADGLDAKEMCEIVRSVNETAVNPDEVLSENVYIVDSRMRITVLDGNEKEKLLENTEMNRHIVSGMKM